MDVMERLKRENKVILFGQDDYLSRVSSYLDELFPSIKKISFPFSLQYDRPDATEFEMSDFEDEIRKIEPMLVIVVFSHKFHDIADEYLKKHGFTDKLYYDAFVDNVLKKKFFASYFKREGRAFLLLKDMISSSAVSDKSVRVYQARSIYDKSIVNKSRETSEFMVPIQVGASLTEKRIVSLCDDTGDNISSRNRRYSEMTAFYWMWKNAKADYLGLCHYRRLWVDLDGIVEKLRTTDVDAVLPLPTLCEHSVYEDYLLKHIPDVWRPMMDVLKEQSPEYYEASKEIFKGRIFYASNMCILKREVLDDLCSWMFPIVMEVENRVGDLQDTYYNRYAGFCTERLITLYFLYNKNNWKIAHAEKVFIG